MSYAGTIPDNQPSTAAKPNLRDEKIVAEIMQLFAELQTWRNTFAIQWEEIAELISPNYKNTFYYNNFNWPGQKKTQRQVDATGMMALHRFGAILDSLLTPRNMQWHGLEASDPYVMKDRQTKLWFEEVTRRLFKLRYAPIANFSSQNQQNYQALGAFGTGSMFIDAYQGVSGERGFRYKAIPLGEMFLRENHQGQIDGFIRWFRLTARQAVQKFGPTQKLPQTILDAHGKNSESPFDFLHAVYPNEEYSPGNLDNSGKKFKSCYVSMEGRSLLSESGYYSFPLACSRYEQGPGEVYGRGPAGMVLPALKTLNAEKTTFLKQGHRAADPVLLGTDDGLIDPNFRPGAFNKGGMSTDGKRLVDVLPTGEIQISEKMMDEEKQLIEAAFLVDLFKVLLADPKIFTATQIVEMASQRGILIAPTVGRQQSEYLGPMIDRELDLMAQLHMLPPMPPRLREARGSYHVVYSSPLSREMRMQEAAGLSKVLETLTPVINITQDPSILDRFKWKSITPDLAEINGLPESWMNSDDEVGQIEQARAQAQERQQQAQEAPAAAQLLTAKAKAAQAGGGQPPGPPSGNPPQ